MENKFLSLNKRDLKDAMLHRLNRLTNLKADSRTFRSRLESTRRELWEIRFEIEQLQDAMLRATVVAFPDSKPDSSPAYTSDTDALPVRKAYSKG